MKFPDGTDIQPGDLVQIGDYWHGIVLASMDTNTYLPGPEDWEYLGVGIMVDTDGAGLVHYVPDTVEDFALLQRRVSTREFAILKNHLVAPR